MSTVEYRKIKDPDKDEGIPGDDMERGKTQSALVSSLPVLSNITSNKTQWKRKSIVTLALTILTSSQAILIVWSKRAGKYEYSVTTANFLVETLKCALSLLALTRIWKREGVTEDNRLSTTLDEVSVYPIPAALYLIKNLLQYYIFAYVDAPGYQILKNLNIISTGVLYRIILKKRLSEIQWAAFILLCAGCTTAQLTSNSDHVLQTPLQGWVMAVVMALLSGFAGVYTEAIIKKRPQRNINVQNFWLYIFGMAFNAVAILVQDFDEVMNKGFFHGYSFITVVMIVNHALRFMPHQWQWCSQQWSPFFCLDFICPLLSSLVQLFFLSRYTCTQLERHNDEFSSLAIPIISNLQEIVPIIYAVCIGWKLIPCVFATLPGSRCCPAEAADSLVHTFKNGAIEHIKKRD